MPAPARRSSPTGAVAQALGLPLVLIVVVVAALAAARAVPALDPYRPQLERVAGALAVGAGVWFAHRVLARLLEWTQRGGRRVTDRAAQVLPLGRRALNVASLVIGLLLVLDQLGVSISPLLAGLGITGIAVALALQPLLTNLFAGSYVLSDASIRVGDYISLQNGPSGHVEDIGWRATRMRNVETGNLIIIPNATLASATVTNYGGAGPTLATVTLTLPRHTDLAEAERTATETLRRLIADDARALAESEPVVLFQSLSADSATCVVTVRAATQADVPALTHEMVKALAARLGAQPAPAPAVADS